jgi:hypothetical protein
MEHAYKHNPSDKGNIRKTKKKAERDVTVSVSRTDNSSNPRSDDDQAA